MRGKVTLALIVMPAVLWALLGLFGQRVVSGVSARYGARILAAGDGKFAAVQPFVKGRLKDGVVLATAACLLLLAYRGISVLANRRLQAPACWIARGWTAFACLNIFVAIAGHTAAFWCLLWAGKEHINLFTQWEVKQRLMEEAEAPRKAVLLGASQTCM